MGRCFSVVYRCWCRDRCIARGLFAAIPTIGELSLGPVLGIGAGIGAALGGIILLALVVSIFVCKPKSKGVEVSPSSEESKVESESVRKN